MKNFEVWKCNIEKHAFGKNVADRPAQHRVSTNHYRNAVCEERFGELCLYLPFYCVGMCTASPKAVRGKAAGALVCMKLVAPNYFRHCVLYHYTFAEKGAVELKKVWWSSII